MIKQGQGITATHMWLAPGVWVPKATHPMCPVLVGAWRCSLAEGHDGGHRDSYGRALVSEPAS